MRRYPAAILLTALALLMCDSFADRLTDLSGQWQKNYIDAMTGFVNMYNPHIIYQPAHPDGNPFRMWFFGWAASDCNSGYPGCDAIFHARSMDLNHWQVYAGNGTWDSTGNAAMWVPVIYARNLQWDSDHNGDPSVALHNGTYYMAYSSTGFSGTTGRVLSCVMGATSSDGISWTRTTNPILSNPNDIGLPVGTNADYGDYHRPSLMFDQGKWKLWFDYWHPQYGTTMGYAECPEAGFTASAQWTIIKAGTNPALANFPNPDVIKVGQKYYAYADPVGYGDNGWMDRHIAEAVSEDGLNWSCTGHIPVDSDSDEQATHVPEAFTIKIGHRTLIVIFYARQAGGDDTGQSPGYDFRYKDIRYCWREAYPAEDVDEDGSVDGSDLLILASDWLGTPAAGTPVAVANPSFEQPLLNDGASVILLPAGPYYNWQPNAFINNGGYPDDVLAAIVNPAVAAPYISAAADGENYLDVDRAVQVNQFISNAVFAVNTVYTLKADFSVPTDAPEGPQNAWCKLALQDSGGNDLAVIGGLWPQTLGIPADTWIPLSASFNTSYSPLVNTYGMKIFIHGDRLNLDNVRIETAVISAGDVNRDGRVNFADLAKVASEWSNPAM
jgi:hypothetical protein